MKSVPPLRAIQVFEAVGRQGSVSRAAEDLGVSPGAITQQIHALEAHLKVRLLQRSGRGVALTAWGTLYLERISAGMEQLRRAKDDVERIRRSGHLVLSALPSLATKWLNPLVFDWMKEHAQASVRLEARDAEPLLERGDADFRISYGARVRNHVHTARLFTDYVAVVASPALLGSSSAPKEPGELLTRPLLWVEWLPEYLVLPDWSEWFRSQGIRCDGLRCKLSFSAPSGAVDAAIEGRGFALVQHSVAAGAIANGALVKVFQHAVQLPEPHFLGWSTAALDKPLGAEFQVWLRAAARRFDYDDGDR
jgi:LysR family transcriptional regulator, glycine cleavage system transcriptional activator